MIENKHKISLHQMQILTFFNILGSSILVFPKTISILSNESYLYSIILGIFLVLISSSIILYSIKINYKSSFTETIESVFGKFFTKAVLILFLIKIVLSATICLNLFLQLNTFVLLPNTNKNIISIIFLLVSGFLCYKGQNVRAKTSQIFFYIIIIFIGLFILISMFKINFDNIPKLSNFTFDDTLNGSLGTFFAFSAIIYFYLDYFYIDNKKDILYKSNSVIIFTGFIILLITIISVSTFSLSGLKFLQFPTFETMSRITVNNSFITRNEAIVVDFFIFVFFSYITTTLFYSSILMKDIFSVKNNNIFIPITIILILIILNIKPNFYYIKVLDTSLSLFFMLFFPAILILFRFFKNKKVKSMSMVLIIPLLLTTLTSCYDKIELEDRRFIYEISVDKKDNMFVLTYAYLSLNEGKDKYLIVKQEEGNTLQSCINNASIHNENTLDFRQIKSIAISEKVLKDEKMLHDIFELLSGNNQLGSEVLLVSYDSDSYNILESDSSEEESLSHYLYNFCKNNHDLYLTSIPFNLDYILLDIRNNQSVLIPKIQKENDFKILGENVFKNFNYEGFINNENLNGYCLVEKNAKGMPIEFFYNNKSVFAKITKSKSKLKFYEENDRLVADYNVTISATLLEYLYLENSEYNFNINTLNKLINDEIIKDTDSFLKYLVENNIDALHLEAKLKKDNKHLYDKYAKDNKDFIKNINFKVNVKTTLNK